MRRPPRVVRTQRQAAWAVDQCPSKLFQKNDCHGAKRIIANLLDCFREGDLLYFVAAFFLRVRTALRLAARLLRFLPLPLYQAKNRSSSASGNDNDTTTVPFGFVLIDRIFLALLTPSLRAVPRRSAILAGVWLGGSQVQYRMEYCVSSS